MKKKSAIGNKSGNIGKSNYETNAHLTLNQELDCTISEGFAIFKEKLFFHFENSLFSNVREKFFQRKNMLKDFKTNILNCIEKINKNINPAYKISEECLYIINSTNDKLENLKAISVKIKNKLNFQQIDKSFKLLFHSVFELVDQMNDLYNYYFKVFNNFNIHEQKLFYDNILNLFLILEQKISQLLYSEEYLIL